MLVIIMGSVPAMTSAMRHYKVACVIVFEIERRDHGVFGANTR